MKKPIIFMLSMIFILIVTSLSYAVDGSNSTVVASVTIPSTLIAPSYSGSKTQTQVSDLTINPLKFKYDEKVIPGETIVFKDVKVKNVGKDKINVTVAYQCPDYLSCMSDFCVPDKKSFVIYPDEEELINFVCDIPMKAKLDAQYRLDVFFHDSLPVKTTLIAETVNIQEYNEWKEEQVNKEKQKAQRNKMLNYALIGLSMFGLFMLLKKVKI